MPSQAEIIYTAGLFDGEGCVHIRVPTISNGRRSLNQLNCILSSTNKEIAFWLKERYQGTVRCRPTPTSQPNRKVQWEWTVVSQQALEFLTLIVPYLRIKKAQAELAIEFQQAKKHTYRSHPYTGDEKALQESQRLLMRKLNHRGIYAT